MNFFAIFISIFSLVNTAYGDYSRQGNFQQEIFLQIELQRNYVRLLT